MGGRVWEEDKGMAHLPMVIQGQVFVLMYDKDAVAEHARLRVCGVFVRRDFQRKSAKNSTK